MEQNLVRYSRAGDVFHYRWAARRCLNLLNHQSALEELFVEGSKDPGRGGECSIDISEYYQNGRVCYFQLKHTSVQKKVAFSFSDLKVTLQRFSERFAEERTSEFYFITNRTVSKQLKNAIAKITKGEGQKTAYLEKIKLLTDLAKKDIPLFLKQLTIIDTEGDFSVQRDDLRRESYAYFTSTAESSELDTLVALVEQRALPPPNGEENKSITKEDVLMQFQVSSEKELFPAPPQFDVVGNPQKREFHDELLTEILSRNGPLIVQATGGVGKTVVAQTLKESVPPPHRVILYDCFGNGSYRNPSEPRHTPRTALVQMSNELAREGLCAPLIPRGHDQDSKFFAAFKERLTQSIEFLRESDARAQLIILIDAADNSEMAANEMNEKGFAKLLFRESLPEGCKLVALCRPGQDRAGLLTPPSACRYYNLPSFTAEESLTHLKSLFPKASVANGQEFHSLSQGNPRVQAFALSEKKDNLEALLAWLGPNQLTVEDLIKEQLESAVTRLRDTLPEITESQILTICRCLAILPPCIPKQVLASAAGLEVSEIDSFVADLGRPLWISENLVYFRDEPTESWFRDRFASDSSHISKIADRLIPAAETYAYAAKALPSLLHQSKRFDELLELALSEQGLPKETHPAELKSISIQRTQFAFKAALSENRLLDALKLALKAAEEMSGTERVDELMGRHSDLIASFLSPVSTQELALSRTLSVDWNGSENIYTALLLSEHPDFKGQALSFLRSAKGWLSTFLEEQRSKKDDDEFERLNSGPSLEAPELASLAHVVLNLEGAESAVKFLSIWRPKFFIYEITSRLFETLIDSGRLEDAISILSKGAHEPHLVVACCEKLLEACYIPPKNPLLKTLGVLADSSDLIEMPRLSVLQQSRGLPIVAFCEAAVANSLDSDKIEQILTKVCESAELSNIAYYEPEPRVTFFRAYSLSLALAGKVDFKDSEIWEKITAEKKDDNYSSRENLPQLFGEYLFPWFLKRAHCLVPHSNIEDSISFGTRIPTAKELSHKGHEALSIGYEVSRVWSEILGLCQQAEKQNFQDVEDRLLQKPGERLRIQDALHLARIVYRHEHLSVLGDSIENFVTNFIEVLKKEPEEEPADYYAQFARAIFPASRSDASAHFSKAIEATSKFGHELNERWRAITAIATKAAESRGKNSIRCNRFFRCAEVVSEGVAREKYWDRCETFAIGMELDPQVAFATWSRWRDRRLISWRPTLLSMAQRAIDKNIMSPSQIWPLTGFVECNSSAELHAECIRKENDREVQKSMKTIALRDLRLASSSFSDYQTLSEVIGFIPDLDETRPPKKMGDALGTKEFDKDKSTLEFDAKVSELLQKCDVNTSKGLRDAIRGFDEIPTVRYPERFWLAIGKMIPRSGRETFLNHLLTIDKFDFLDLIDVLPILRRWTGSAAIKALWPEFLEKMGACFPDSALSIGCEKYYVSSGKLSIEEFTRLQEGVFSSFAETTGIHGYSTFLDFVSQNVTRLNTEDAGSLLDFSLERMEIYIADDFGEGTIELIDDPLSPLSGLLWSCLASPYAKERWQAAHCVRRLAVAKNKSEIDDLVKRMKKEEVGFFGCADYDFYLLHARLYLLTAFNRIAMDDVAVLSGHAEFFASQALEGPTHFLIQSTAAELCLRIIKYVPECLDNEVVGLLEKVGKSQFPIKTYDKRPEEKNAPWDEPVTPDTERNHFFENDFGWYWFPSLSQIFGVGQLDIEYLSKYFIEKELEIIPQPNSHWLRDKRTNSRSDHRSRSENFYHSHSSYPSADTLDFYCEYHSFLHSAGRLLETAPILKEDSDYCSEDEDPFTSWAESHSLTLEDGTWLSDHRDSAPRKHRNWLSESISDDWKTDISEEDFEEILHDLAPLDDWLILAGNWTECKESVYETLRVKAALVDSITTESLANFLSSQESPYDFGFPDFDDDDFSYSEKPFVLQGILLRNPEGDHDLASFDLYAGDLPYPRLRIAPEYASLLGIKSDSESREYRRESDDSPVIVNEIWNQQGDETQKVFPSGRRMSCHREILVELCQKLKMNLIFCVEIHRSYQPGSYQASKQSESEDRLHPPFKIFTLSADGKIRTT